MNGSIVRDDPDSFGPDGTRGKSIAVVMADLLVRVPLPSSRGSRAAADGRPPKVASGEDPGMRITRARVFGEPTANFVFSSARNISTMGPVRRLPARAAAHRGPC